MKKLKIFIDFCLYTITGRYLFGAILTFLGGIMSYEGFIGGYLNLPWVFNKVFETLLGDGLIILAIQLSYHILVGSWYILKRTFTKSSKK